MERKLFLDVSFALFPVIRIEHYYIDKAEYLDKLCVAVNKKRTDKLLNYITVIMRRRQFIYRVVICAVLLTLIITILIPNHYTATTTILPPNPERDAMMGLLMSSMPSMIGLSQMGGMFGGATPSDLYAAMLKSRTIMDRVIEKHDLQKVFKTRRIDDTYKELLAITQVIVSAEELISVAVTHKDKFLAAQIANTYFEELDRFNTKTAMTTGKKYRIFVEERLNQNSDTLAVNEEALRDFQEKHHTIALDAEIQSIIETIAELKSRIILLEVQKGAMASGSNLNNPYVYSIEKELRELRNQLAKIEFGSKKKDKKGFGVGFSIPLSELPEVSLEYARLLRDVKIQEAIYELLVQQYEQAKIMELKDTPTIQVLDYAVPPEKKSYPRRSIIIVTVFLIALVTGIALAFFFEYIEEMKGKSEDYPRWKTIFLDLKNDLLSVKQKLPFIRKL